jgi:hypothetical protein
VAEAEDHRLQLRVDVQLPEDVRHWLRWVLRFGSLTADTKLELESRARPARRMWRDDDEGEGTVSRA